MVLQIPVYVHAVHIPLKLPDDFRLCSVLEGNNVWTKLRTTETIQHLTMCEVPW